MACRKGKTRIEREIIKTNSFVLDPRKCVQVSETLRPFLCMDLAFQHELLIWGFRIPEDREITLVKQIQYGDQLVEAAWPLGAAIDLLST